MIPFLSQFTAPVIYMLLGLLLVAAGFGNPIPEDVALVAGGYLASQGEIGLWPTLIICYVGVLLGDLILYGLGRRYGQHIITHKWLVRMIPPHRIERIRQSFIRRGYYTILFARFLIGFRSPTFLLSGVMRLPFRRFILLDALGGLVSVPLFVGLGVMFGSSVETLSHDIRRFEYWALLVAVIVVVALLALYWRRIKAEEVEDKRKLGMVD